MRRPARTSPRRRGYDYGRPGAYFVAICTQGRACLFGEVVGGAVRLSAAGEIAAACWRAIPEHHAGVGLDAFVVMPDHVHGLVLLLGPDAPGGADVEPDLGAVPPSELRRDRACPVPTQGGRAAGARDEDARRGPASSVSLSTVGGSYKSAVTREVNRQRGAPGAAVWQPRFYGHVVRLRDRGALARVRRYVEENPARWALARERPDGGG